MLLRKGEKMVDLTNGKEYELADVSGDKYTLSDGRVMSLDWLKTAFKFLGNDTPMANPTASIDATGTLIVDGTAVETGTLVPKRLLTTYNGHVVLSATFEKGDTTFKKLYDYDIEHNKFFAVAALPDTGDETLLFSDADTGTYAFIEKATDQHLVHPEDGGTDSKPVNETGNLEFLYVIENRNIKFSKKAMRYSYGTLFSKDSDEDLVRLTLVSNVEYDVKTDTLYNDFNVEKAEPSERTMITNLVLMKSKDDDGKTIGYNVLHGDVYQAKAEGNVLNVTTYYARKDGSILVTTSKGICYVTSNRAPRFAYSNAIVEAAKSHPYLADIAINGGATKFALISNDYTKKVVTVTLTDDRGYISKVE